MASDERGTLHYLLAILIPAALILMGLGRYESAVAYLAVSGWIVVMLATERR